MKLKIETKILKSMLESVKRGVACNETVHKGVHLEVINRNFDFNNL